MASTHKHHPRNIDRIIFESAKQWLASSLILKIAAFLLGGISVLFSVLTQATPFILAFLSIAAELCAWRSDYRRGMADEVSRKVDMEDSFGWTIKPHELADIIMLMSDKESKEAMKPIIEPYFASKKAPGIERALGNLQQSSWFSHHIAKRMSLIYLFITIGLTVASIWLLIISVETLQNTNTLAAIGRLVTSVMVLIFSLGLARSSYSYYWFSVKAGSIEKSARDLLRTSSTAETEAIHLWHDYQLARRTSPMLPTWLWKSMRGRLNEVWETYHSAEQSKSA